jgi:hypothetical protein
MSLRALYQEREGNHIAAAAALKHIAALLCLIRLKLLRRAFILLELLPLLLITKVAYLSILSFIYFDYLTNAISRANSSSVISIVWEVRVFITIRQCPRSFSTKFSSLLCV